MNLETKITIYKFTPQVFTLTPFYRKKSPFTFIQLLIIENEKVKGEPLLDKYIRN